MPEKSRYLVHISLNGCHSRARYHRMRLVEIFSHLDYVGREGVVDSVRDGGDARIGSSDVTVRVEATNFATTTRHESTAQARFAGED
ncbi:hypothetical protein Gotur_035323 [Gossypium turneri]